jgi:uncharacterized protein
MKASRIAGLDLAYAVCICFIVIFSLSAGFQANLGVSYGVVYNPVIDTFAGVYLFLNGATAALMLKAAPNRSKRLRGYLVRKGAILTVIGIPLSILWPTNFLITLGILFLFSPLLIQLSSTILRFIVIGILSYAVLHYLFLESLLNSVNSNIQPRFWTWFQDSLAFILTNGYYAILHWGAFFIAGILFVRMDFLNSRRATTNYAIGVMAVLLGGLVQFMTANYSFETFALKPIKTFPYLFSTHFSLPAFLITALGISVILVNWCVKLCKTYRRSKVLALAQKMGSIKHTVYINHIVIAIILSHLIDHSILTKPLMNLGLSLAYISISLIFTALWKKQFNLGPVEWVFHRLSGTNEKL